MNNPPLPGETSIRDFLTAVASVHEAHGAVSAAAVAGALGSSLLVMVAALPPMRSDVIADRTMLMDATTALSDIREQLIETIETETAVRIFAARNMPQASETERHARQAAIQFALRAAADVPLEVMRLCARGLRYAETVATHSPRPKSTDVQLAVALLHAAFSGARSNLEMRLSSLTATGYIASVIDEIARLSDDAATAARAAESASQVPPA
ncbi:MAG: cyclodeaminase/cyclohydrolase family protein [Bradyrhizobium canariense]